MLARQLIAAMPEILAVVAVFVVTVIAWVGAWLQARDPARQNPREDYEELQRQVARLEQRLAVARREKWDAAMIANLAERLRTATSQVTAKRSGT